MPRGGVRPSRPPLDPPIDANHFDFKKGFPLLYASFRDIDFYWYGFESTLESSVEY